MAARAAVDARPMLIVSELAIETFLSVLILLPRGCFCLLDEGPSGILSDTLLYQNPDLAAMLPSDCAGSIAGIAE
jgi:hypothetical protein